MAITFTPATPAEVLGRLKAKSEDLAKLALVLAAARSLAEWSDAQSAMASIMESCGDLLDSVDSAELGFVNDTRKATPAVELIARGSRLQSALHYYCGAPLSPETTDKPWKETD